MEKKNFRTVGTMVVGTIIFGALCSMVPTYEAMAQSSKDWTPPKLISLASISVSSVGFAAGSGIVSSITDKTGVDFRIEPAPTSIDRRERVESGMVEFSISAGGHAYSLQTGLADFDVKGYGPAPVRTIWSGGFMNGGYMVRGDSGIKTVADIKGKKVANYPGYPGMNMNMEGLLAYANLTWDDVKKIPVGGFVPGMVAVIEGSVDVAFAPSSSKPAIELAASPHGIHWLPMPASDKEQWERYRNLWGAWSPGKAFYGAGISKDKPAEIMRWTNNITTQESQDDNLCYWMTKQIAENYDSFKNKHGYLKSWTIEQALNTDAWLVPYHDGSIRYFKEIGKWNSEQESRQQELIKEQKDRRAAWVKAHPDW